MGSSWIALLGALAVASILLLAPGAALGRLAGLRGLWLWGGAPVYSVTAISLAGVIAGLVGMPWSILAVALTTAVLAAVLLALRRLPGWRGQARPSGPALDRRVWGAVPVVAGLVIVLQSAAALGRPDAISQTFDNVYHLNAIRYLVDVGTASPFEVGAMTSPTQWFYPIGWHAVASLLVQLIGVSVPIAANATWIAFAAVAWPLGAVLLARAFAGGGLAAAVTTAAVIPAIPAFPLLMSTYGVLYPYGAGLALVPFALAATALLFRLTGHRLGIPAPTAAIALLGALPALALTHPGALMGWLAFAVPVVVVALVRRIRRRGWRASTWPIIGLAAFVLVGLAAVRVLRPPYEATLWPARGTIGQAVGEVITVSVNGSPVPVVVAVLTVTGLVVLLRRRSARDLALLGVFLVAAGLYVVVAGVWHPAIRDFLTAPWYNNTPRLAALLALPVVPVAAAGGRAVIDAIVRSRAVSRWNAGHRRGAAVLAASGAVVLLVAAQGNTMPEAVRDAQRTYAMGPGAPLLSPDEWELLTQLDELVEADAVIAGSPWTGAGLAYAIAGREVLMPHMLMYVDPAGEAVNEGLDEAVAGGATCRAIAERNVGYVLDFGDREVHGGEHPFTGFDDLATSDAVELVTSVGDAALYRVVACD